MRIEKISDKQIRCTLTSADLQNHHINIGELAYGSEKARSLFQEMLSQASKEFNFHAENIPLMIEAVPLSGDSLVLVITKVEDPDEIDTRFSKFSPSIDDEDEMVNSFLDTDPVFSDIKADDIIEELHRLCMEHSLPIDEEETSPASELDFVRIYTFSSIDDICRASRALQDAYDAENSLYKDPLHGRYYLVVHKGEHSPQTFNKICNILSEYAKNVQNNAGTEASYKEHFSTIISAHALQSLKQL